jgi:23S rRNA (adenine2030-N6)-methyltransferase
MNYRHIYHAGNFADVHKHVALVAILLHLKRKETPFAVIDTHAGPGCYDLGAEQALRTGEAHQGIARLRDYVARTAAVGAYLDLVRRFLPERYPGSPLIAANLLRMQDQLVASEKESEECAALRDALRHVANAQTVCADGYAKLVSLLPPPERRGLVLIDPPYEDANERQCLAKSFSEAYRRFATGIYMVWHPLKSAVPVDALAGELAGAGAVKLLSLIFNIGLSQDDAPERLAGSGVLVANPPYGFDVEMKAAQKELLPLLARGASAKESVEWLAGGP